MELCEIAWIAPLIPIICFVIAGLFGNKLKEGGGYVVIAGAALSCLISIIVTIAYLTSDYYAHGQAFVSSVQWIAINGHSINFGVYIDGLACMMMLFASFISTLIFVYSLGYMSDQGERKRRYYAEVSLFLTGMMGLVVSSNFLEMFIFWEIMGLCSYLLIGFWSFKHPEGDEKAINAASAAKKAFLVTRLGDVCLMGGLCILLFLFNSLDYNVVLNEDNITAILEVENNKNMLMLACLLIFGGVIGKSAQFPLHDWLPDAMAGPTTVSALIHAATMVKAGVYLTARSFPIFVRVDENVMLFVAIIGGVTAIFAASMALNNMNIKRVLAYSTLSQLGYMILALGAGGYLMAKGLQTENHTLIELGVAGYIAGVFHMLNHAFFKALLFLGSGSVIHACGTEDMRLMGGLAKKMKITSMTMFIGSLSIAGFPLLSGFWSKDLVLDAAFGPYKEGLGAGSWFCVLFVLGLITAFMTAFYMFRMWFMTFVGEPREKAAHCHGESPKVMTMPLMILAIFAMASGLLVLLGLNDVVGKSLVPSGLLPETYHFHSGLDTAVELFTNVWTYVSIVLALLGIYVAYLMYCVRRVDPGKFNNDGRMGLYKLLTNRYYFPQLYNGISWILGYRVSKGVEIFDKNVIDGSVNSLSNTVIGGGDALMRVQTGYVRNYVAYIAIGLIVLTLVALGVLKYSGVI